MRDTLLFSKKKTQVAPRSSCYRQIPTFVRTKSRRACAKLSSAQLLPVRSGEATVIWAYRSVRLSRETDSRFSVYADINKSTTWD